MVLRNDDEGRKDDHVVTDSVRRSSRLVRGQIARWARLLPAISRDTRVNQSEAAGGDALDFLENETEESFFYFPKASVCRDKVGKHTEIKIGSNSYFGLNAALFLLSLVWFQYVVKINLRQNLDPIFLPYDPTLTSEVPPSPGCFDQWYSYGAFNLCQSNFPTWHLYLVGGFFGHNWRIQTLTLNCAACAGLPKFSHLNSSVWAWRRASSSGVAMVTCGRKRHSHVGDSYSAQPSVLQMSPSSSSSTLNLQQRHTSADALRSNWAAGQIIGRQEVLL